GCPTSSAWRYSTHDFREVGEIVIPYLATSFLKGSRKNNFPEFAPRFGSDWVDLREQNRSRSKAYVEDFASEDWPKLA
ncbi:MAG: hypothetical protein VST67_08640, partial [Nitrospirota bacterium]|nr:hypothetical protein [Nitrospirota bacterium]